jgi:DNA-directed RNA polymerase subunit beta'
MSNITTPGAILIKSMLPTKEARDAHDVYKVLDKKGVHDLITNLMKYGGEEAHEVINVLGQTFFNKATDIGASTPLDDYDNDSSERQAMLGEFEHKIKAILASKKTKEEKDKEMFDLADVFQGQFNKANLLHMVGKGSTAAKMALTGARGNPDQLAQATGSPLMSTDVKGNFIPIVIKKSFAEGLSPAEHLAMSYKGRSNTVLAQLSTALPGALFKQLTPNLFHEVITIPDCHTTNGILFPVSDKKSVLGRYEAGTNKFIDETYLKEVSMSKKEIKVRSPMTCEAHEGVCQKCYGLMANSKLPKIGENVGVIASQSVSEVLTQAMLSTKHRAKVGGGGNAYEQANNLLNNPAENFRDEAGMATLDGKVTSVKQTPLKDYDITINNVPHFVSRVQEPSVKVGDIVRAGDPLSTGTLNPRKLVELKGLGAGRKYFTSKLRDIYGTGLDNRHFELISKNLLKYGEIQNPGNTGFLPGQKVSIPQIEKHLQSDAHDIPLSGALGKTLARGVLEMVPGTVLTQNHIDDLANSGVSSVNISNSGLSVRPIVPGLKTAKLLDNNWVSKLSFSRLRDTIKDAAAVGAESPVHSTDPITPYIIGNEFGEGENGQY